MMLALRSRMPSAAPSSFIRRRISLSASTFP
jgi:hypothetical protein